MAKTVRINFRLSGNDAERFLAVWEGVLERTLGEAKRTNVIKELMGLRPLKLVTQSDLDLLSGRTPSPPASKLPHGRTRSRAYRIVNGFDNKSGE